MRYSREELERLMDFIDSGEQRIKESKRIVCKNTYDFRIWYKYSIEEERCNYPSMLGINTLTGKMINEKLSWLKEKEYKGVILTLDYIIESMEILYDEGELSREEIDNIKRELIKLNFGSVKNIW